MSDLSHPLSIASATGQRTAGLRARGLRRLCDRLPEPAVLSAGGRIRHVNQGALALLGCDGGPADAQVLHALLAVLPRPGLPAQPDGVTVVRADGDLRTVRVSAVPLPRGGRRSVVWLLHDITADRHARGRLQQAHDHLAELTVAVDVEQQQRRRQAARRVHDELLQSLVAIRMHLDAAANGLDTAQALQRSVSIAQSALASGRDIVRELGSQMLTELGLAASLDAMAADFARRRRRPCSFRVRGVDTQVVPASSAALDCLYRVAEEALTTIERHGRAVRLRLRLRLAGDRQGGLALRIIDDGGGLQADGSGDALDLGLQILRQRVQALGGRLTVHGAPGARTTLAVRLPVAGMPHGAAQVQRDTSEAVLMRFFYRAPVGLVQAALDGRIELMNPLAACCLLPFSPDGALDNLFDTLSSAVPQLAAQALALQGADGVLCDNLQIHRGRGRPVWLTVTKQAGARWMAVLGETPAQMPAAPGPAERAHARVA